MQNALLTHLKHPLWAPSYICSHGIFSPFFSVVLCLGLHFPEWVLHLYWMAKDGREEFSSCLVSLKLALDFCFSWGHQAWSLISLF